MGTCVRDLFRWGWLQGLLYRNWLPWMTSCPTPCPLGLMLGTAPEKYLSALVDYREFLGVGPLGSHWELKWDWGSRMRSLEISGSWTRAHTGPQPWEPVLREPMPWASCPATYHPPDAGGGLSALSAGGPGSTSASPEVPGQLMGHQPAQGTWCSSIHPRASLQLRSPPCRTWKS